MIITKGGYKKYEIGDKVKVPDGYLTYLGDSGKRTKSKSVIGLWQCISSCPRKTIQFECVNSSISKDYTRSCGCLCDKKIKEIDENKVYLKTIHTHMKQSCYNKNNIGYKNYGGRGISMQEDWINDYKKFETDLLEKIGHRPTEKYSLDRMNVNGNYEINNLRWATKKDQANNRTSNVSITINNITKNASEWAEENNLSICTILRRKSRGWTGEKLLKPSNRKNKKIFDSKNLYWIWWNVKQRTNINSTNSFNYGNRGISMYEPWKKSYKVFQKDIIDSIGERPSANHSLDRMNNDGNYEPDNLRWATNKEQANNKQNTIYVEYNNVKMSLAEAAEKSGISHSLLKSRLDNGIKKGLFSSKEVLTLSEIEEIKKLKINGTTISKIAEIYKINSKTVNNICLKRGAYTEEKINLRKEKEENLEISPNIILSNN